MEYKIKPVYPETEVSVGCLDETGHIYVLQNFKGYQKGYSNNAVTLSFIKKLENGTLVEGLQSEQLVEMLIHRTTLLNNKFSSPQFPKMIQGLEMFLEACKERVDDRVNRGVMGELKK